MSSSMFAVLDLHGNDWALGTKQALSLCDGELALLQIDIDVRPSGHREWNWGVRGVCENEELE